MELYERVKYLRKTVLKMTQENFGNALGVNRDMIVNIENNRLKNPGQKGAVYKLICEKFNVSEEWLQTGDGEMFNPVEDETAALLSDVLGDPDHPLYQIILSILKTYGELDENGKQTIKQFSSNLIQNIKKAED